MQEAFLATGSAAEGRAIYIPGKCNVHFIMIVVVNDHFLMKRPFLYESSPWTHCPGQDLGERGLGSSLAACFSGYVPFQLYPEESIIILEANAKPYAYHGMGDNGWSLHD